MMMMMMMTTTTTTTTLMMIMMMMIVIMMMMMVMMMMIMIIINLIYLAQFDAYGSHTQLYIVINWLQTHYIQKCINIHGQSYPQT